jgi:hypothetical protein
MERRTVNICIDSVDHAPDDLYRQTPLRGRLLRTIAKHDRSDRFRTASADYWLAELGTPLSWTKDGVTRTIRHLVLAARWEGTSIQRGAKLPVGIAYVVDDSLLSSESFDFTQGRIRRDWHGKGIRAALLVEDLDQALSEASISRNRLSRAQDAEGRFTSSLKLVPI